MTTVLTASVRDGQLNLSLVSPFNRHRQCLHHDISRHARRQAIAHPILSYTRLSLQPHITNLFHYRLVFIWLSKNGWATYVKIIPSFILTVLVIGWLCISLQSISCSLLVRSCFMCLLLEVLELLVGCHWNPNYRIPFSLHSMIKASNLTLAIISILPSTASKR